MNTRREGWADKLAQWADDAERIRGDLEGPGRPSPSTRRGQTVKASAVASMADRITGTAALLLQGVAAIHDSHLYPQAAATVESIASKAQAGELQAGGIKVTRHALAALHQIAQAVTVADWCSRHRGADAARIGEHIAKAMQCHGAMLQALADPRPKVRHGSKAARLRELCQQNPEASTAELRRMLDTPMDERELRRLIATERTKTPPI